VHNEPEVRRRLVLRPAGRHATCKQQQQHQAQQQADQGNSRTSINSTSPCVHMIACTCVTFAALHASTEFCSMCLKVEQLAQLTAAAATAEQLQHTFAGVDSKLVCVLFGKFMVSVQLLCEVQL
jgi:hypothetical protein